jgi:hypothetical protein
MLKRLAKLTAFDEDTDKREGLFIGHNCRNRRALHDACIDEHNAYLASLRKTEIFDTREAMDSPPTRWTAFSLRDHLLYHGRTPTDLLSSVLNQLTTPTKRQMDPWIQDCQRTAVTTCICQLIPDLEST